MIICTYDLHIYILWIVLFGCEALFYQLKIFFKKGTQIFLRHSSIPSNHVTIILTQKLNLELY